MFPNQGSVVLHCWSSCWFILFSSKSWPNGTPNLSCVLKLGRVSISWESSYPTFRLTLANSFFGHVKSELSSRLTNSESQAKVMLGVHQEHDLSLLVTRQVRCCGSRTLPEGLLAKSPNSFKINRYPWESCVNGSRSFSPRSFPTFKYDLRLRIEWRLFPKPECDI